MAVNYTNPGIPWVSEESDVRSKWLKSTVTGKQGGNEKAGSGRWKSSSEMPLQQTQYRQTDGQTEIGVALLWSVEICERQKYKKTAEKRIFVVRIAR